jgi:hypothetical protein
MVRAVLLQDVLLSLAVVLTASLVHWGLRRLARRLPVVLARRSPSSGTASRGVTLPWQRPLEIAAMGINVGIWVGVALFLSQRFALLGAWRRAAAILVSMSFTAHRRREAITW